MKRKNKTGIGNSLEAIVYRRNVRQRFKEKHPKYGMKSYRFRRFGITQEQFNILRDEQNNRCAICGEMEPGFRDGIRKELAIDHNRITGKIRGLLCSLCNTAIGSMRENIDNLQKTINYLNRYSETAYDVDNKNVVLNKETDNDKKLEKQE